MAAVRRARSGSVLLVTVLLLIVAAGVAFITVRGALSVEDAEGDRTDLLQQIRTAAAGHRRAQSDLTADPLLLLRQVLDGEADRYCSTTGTTFAAGQAWPEECGLTWSYLEADRTDGLLLTPPTAADRDLRMLTLLDSEQGLVGVESRYRPGSVRSFLHADADLDLTGLTWLTPAGLLTAGGNLTLGGQDGASDGFAVLAGGSISSPSPATATNTPVRPLSGSGATAVAGRTLQGGLQATWTQIRQQACRSLCLEPGGSVRAVDGSQVTLPEATASIRIGLHGDRATLHTSTLRLDATSLSGAAFATPGGDDDFWGTPVVTLTLPEAGLIATDLDVVLAPCLDGEAGCGRYDRSFTLLAGSAGRPAVLALAGEITAGDGQAAGVGVIGEIIRAPWNPGLDSSSLMQLSVSILDGQEAAFGLYGAVPANQNAWDNHTTRLDGTFAFSGSPDLTAAGLQLTYDAAVADRPPPWWPGVDLEPVRRGTRLLDPAETAAALAALPVGPAAAGTVPGAPTLQTVSGTAGQLTLTFTPPAWTGSSSITGYQYSIDDGVTWADRQTGSTGSPLTITGLEAGGSFPVRIRAVNASGPGLRSNMLTGRAGLGVEAPGVPTGLVAVPTGYLLSTGDGGSNGAVLLSWTADPDASAYQVSYRLQGGSVWIPAGSSTGTSLLVDGLDGQATYELTVQAQNAAGTSSMATAVTSGAVVAGGGTVTSFVADGSNGTAGTRYVVHTFTAVGEGTLTFNRDVDVEYLIVGGGGGTDGTNSNRGFGGGGGGGGGLLQGSTSLSAGTLSLTVGAGGGAGTPEVLNSTDGQSSRLGDSLVASGGGRGRRGNINPGVDGGSGGGAGSVDGNLTPQPGGSPVAGQGSSGGASQTSSSTSGLAGGGGGGAGGAGQAGSTGAGGGGGTGLTSAISGSPVTYAGGGGGGSSDGAGGAGGAGGGGAGGGAVVEDGVNGLGGGAGGRGTIQQAGTGGAGGSGVVIVRYPLTLP